MRSAQVLAYGSSALRARNYVVDLERIAGTGRTAAHPAELFLSEHLTGEALVLGT
jgi:hypothetical protein